MKRTIFLLILLAYTPSVLASETPQEIPKSGMVTMVDLGAKTCIPCKMMAPILEELTELYMGKAAIFFIDVWQTPSLSKKFKVSVIPTQIFFDSSGNEVYRHMGFMDKKSIIGQLEKMGVAAPPGK